MRERTVLEMAPKKGVAQAVDSVSRVVTAGFKKVKMLFSRTWVVEGRGGMLETEHTQRSRSRLLYR